MHMWLGRSSFRSQLSTVYMINLLLATETIQSRASMLFPAGSTWLGTLSEKRAANTTSDDADTNCGIFVPVSATKHLSNALGCYEKFNKLNISDPCKLPKIFFTAINLIFNLPELSCNNIYTGR